MGLPERALPCFESLMAMGDVRRIRCSSRTSLFQLDRHLEAMERFKCLDIEPEHAEVHRYLGRSLMAMD